ncbi:MAG TPA: hypothetical protein VLU25_21095 [Acidobacteriota bacterium]|nr:hypothetical protein [Acidobacteriota bacterium]
MDDRQQYQKRMEERINSLGRRIDELLSQAEASARRECQQLPDRLKTARVKLDELGRESEEAWRDLRPGLEKAWGELRQAVRQASSRFRSSQQAGEPDP